jgi:CysZ protein
MKLFQDFAWAIAAFPQAIRFSQKHQLWSYFVIPALVNLLIFIGLSGLALFYAEQTADYVQTTYLADWLQVNGEASWWQQSIMGLAEILILLAAGILCLLVYRFLILSLLAPALAKVAEKVQTILLEVPEPPFDGKQLLRDVIRGLRLSLRNLLIELSLTFLLLLASLFFPLISPFTTVLILLLQCYFVGFSMMDYRNEFLKMSAQDSVQYIRSHKGFALGNGLIFHFLLFIPVAGVLFAPILTVIAAGIGVHRLEKK